MLDENSKIMMYKVIGAVTYTLVDDHIFLDIIGLIQEKLPGHGNKFSNTKFNNVSELRISNISMNILSCHEFSKSSISTVILICHN